MKAERYTMFGRIVFDNNETHQLLTGLRVKAVTREKDREHVIGEARSDSTGNFFIEISQPGLQTNGISKFMLKVYDDEEILLTDSVAAPKKKDNGQVTKLTIAEAPDEESEVDPNVGKARKLLVSLFKRDSGGQKEYRTNPRTAPRTIDAVHSLTAFDRVWASSQGAALHQAARRFDERKKESDRNRVEKLNQWLLKEIVHVRLEDGSQSLGGWHFSQNTRMALVENTLILLDKFKDPRLVTGANALALNGIARYIVSSAFSRLSKKKKKTMHRFYGNILDGLLKHQRLEDGLFTSGWDLYILQNIKEDENYIKNTILHDIRSIFYVLKSNDKKEQQKVKEILRGGQEDLDFLIHKIKDGATEKFVRDFLAPDSGNLCGRNYNSILQISGYPDDEDSPFYQRVPDDPWRQYVKARNIETRHNLEMLAVFNFAVDNALPLGLVDSKKEELKRRKNHLRYGIFSKLYDNRKKRMITGRDSQDSPKMQPLLTMPLGSLHRPTCLPPIKVVSAPCKGIAWAMGYCIPSITIQKTSSLKVIPILEPIS